MNTSLNTPKPEFPSNNIEVVKETILNGLTLAEVDERILDGRINKVPDAPVRTTSQILRANILTPVNGIMATLLAVILVAGFPGDALFAGVIFSNSVIGIVQELRARKTLTELAVLSAPKARVIRAGVTSEIEVSEVVADDLLELAPGDQIVVDGNVVDAEGLTVDESLLTGEADPVTKEEDDEALSGSFVSSGSGYLRATRIGADAYAATLAEEARRFSLSNSELRGGVNTILRWLIVIIPPAALLLLARLVAEENLWQEALRGTVAASVAMVPDGLVLLTSLSFIVGVIALARRQALAKELSSVELLARVDVLCLDKTGTITTGDFSCVGMDLLGEITANEVAKILGGMAASDRKPNPTLTAIAKAYPDPEWNVDTALPFSSSRKWASVHFKNHGLYHLGAPEILLPENTQTRRKIAKEASNGRRVLALTKSVSETFDLLEVLPAEREPVALVLIEDTVKPDAQEILKYFTEQGVNLKVISGDHPTTVAAVARRAGIPNAQVGIDARELPEKAAELAEVVERETIFGRVTPHQKRSIIKTLQSEGHTVAMTGDGVNDVLALKDADMGIAMGSGSEATRAVAQLVLLDNQFGTLPRVLSEGRRVINNIERVANLFITKATYAVLLTALVGLLGAPFPFLPKQLTLIGTFSIGVPGFFLALEADASLVRPGFLSRVLRYSLPAGVLAGIATFTCYESVRAGEASLAEARTTATMTLLTLGLIILLSISRPLRPWKLGLALTMAFSYVLVMTLEAGRNFFELDSPPTSGWIIAATCAIVGGFAITMVPRLVDRSTR